MAPFLSGWVGLASLVLPSWDQLESKLPSTKAPIFEDSTPFDSAEDGRPILFRDKEGICPFSQQVWLALEVKNIDYVTVLIDTTMEENSWSSPLRLEWPDGSSQTDALEILEKLQQEYLEADPHLYPSLSMCVDSVRCNIVRFKGVFPRNSQANPYAPYLLRQNTDWVPDSDHMVTLEETDEVLEEYYQGPFLCGAHITAADIVWAPFLERYAAQLPLIFEGEDLTPRSSEYETLKEWYEAMEEKVPAYACRVMGDKTSWERLLRKGVDEKRVPQVDLLPSRGKAIPTNRRKVKADAIWKEYASTRPFLTSSCEEECVAFHVRNRESIIAEATQVLTNMKGDEIDKALREVLAAVLQGGDDDLSGNAKQVMSFLDERLCVPRDMGVLPASTLRTLALAATNNRVAV